MPKKTINNKILILAIVAGLLIAGGSVILFQQNAKGRQLNQPSSRALEMTAEQESSAEFEVSNNCFSFKSDLPLTNLRQQTENEICTLNASIAEPKSFISIKAEPKEPDFKLEELPSIKLREKDQQYSREIIFVPGEKEGELETVSYSSDSDLVTFIWQEPVLVTVSSYDFNDLDKELVANLEAIIASLEIN